MHSKTVVQQHTIYVISHSGRIRPQQNARVINSAEISAVLLVCCGPISAHKAGKETQMVARQGVDPRNMVAYKFQCVGLSFCPVADGAL